MFLPISLRRIALFLLLSGFAFGQGAQLPKYTVATLPSAASYPSYTVQVIDGSTNSDCTVGGGSYNVICTAHSGVWTPVGGTSSVAGTSPIQVNGSSGTPQVGAVNVSCPTCGASQQFQITYQPPIAGQYIVMYPLACSVNSSTVAAASCSTQSNAGSLTVNRWASGSTVIPTNVGATSTGWAYNGVAGLPSFVSAANVTAVYGVEWAYSTSTYGNLSNTIAGFGMGMPGHGGIGWTSYSVKVDAGSPTTFNFATTTATMYNNASGNVSNFNDLTTVYPALIVYYTGSAPPATSTVPVNAPLSFDASGLGLQWPFNYSGDTGTTGSAYAISLPFLLKNVNGSVFNNISSGADVWFDPAHTNTVTNPTLNLNGYYPGTGTILGRGSGAIAVGDIVAGFDAHVEWGSDGNWHLQNPQTGSGGVTSVSNSDGSLTFSPTTGAVVGSINYAHAGTWTALETFNAGVSIPSGQGVTQTTGGSAANCWNTAGTTSACSGGGGGTAGVSGNPQYNAAGSFGGASNIFYSQTGDTIASIEAECSALCTYIVNQPQTFTLAANHTLSSNVNVEFKADGEWTVNGSGFVLTIGGAVSGPPTQHFAGTAAILLSANTLFDYAEWFGAKGDGTTDDSVALQDAINAVSGGGAAATNTGTGYVQLLAKTYLANTGLTIQNGGVGIVGITANTATNPGSEITTSSATITQLTISGSSSNWLQDNRVERFSLVRTVQPSAGATGISVTYTFMNVLDNVGVFDSARGIYAANVSSVAGAWENVDIWHSSISGCGSGPYYGFYIDESSGTTPSLRIRNSFVGFNAGCASSYGLYATGPHIEDIHVRHLETAQLGYGVYLNSTGSSAYFNFDDHFQDDILDSCQVSCIYVTGMTNAGNSGVTFEGGEASVASGVGPVVDIEASNGVIVSGITFAETGSGTITKINGGAANQFVNNTITPLRSNSTGVLLSNTSGNIIAANTIRGQSTTSVTGISLTAASRNVISANTLTGSMTTGVSLDATSSYNDLYNVNQIDPTNITTPYANSGSNNQIGVGGMTNPMTTLGDMIVGGSGGSPTRVSGNTSTTTECFTQTGTGTASAAPVWGSCAGTGGSINLENGGTPLGAITNLNCGTGTTCSASAGTGTIIASGSGAEANLCAVVTLTNATCSSGIISVNPGSTSFAISSIPSTYINLLLESSGYGSSTSSGASLNVTINGDSAADYVWTYASVYGNGTTFNQGSTSATTSALNMGTVGTASGWAASGTMKFPFYSSALASKSIISDYQQSPGSVSGFAGSTVRSYAAAAWKGSAAISSITLTAASGTISSLEVTLYGIN